LHIHFCGGCADYRGVDHSPDVIHGDRRANRRYELGLHVCFSYSDAAGSHLGCGVTADLSRGGLRFTTPEPPPIHADVEARIAWPYLLQGVCPLEVVVRGTVVSSTARGAVVRIRSYEFRTCGERSFSEHPEERRIERIA
jgi:hypothetical protein